MRNRKLRRREVFGIVLLGAAGFAAFALLLLFVEGWPAVMKAVFRLFAGFVFFLRENLPRMSWNSATWLPGVLAFLLVLAAVHRPLRAWGAKHGKRWDLACTCCLGLLLPLLFATSFLVPGVLLQVRQLAAVPWFQEERSTAQALIRERMRELHMRLHLRDEDSDRYPDTLGEEYADYFVAPDGPGMFLEPFVYPGSGLPFDCDPATSIIISPPYLKKGGSRRLVLTAGGNLVEISDAEVGDWLGVAASVPP